MREDERGEDSKSEARGQATTSYAGNNNNGSGETADEHLPVHPDDRVYVRRPWKQTLEDVCLWREERIAAGDDRWPGTVTKDSRERMLGKWLANQRSYRKLMDAYPQNRRGLKGMCPERVRLLDARLPGWMGTEPNEQVVVGVGVRGGMGGEMGGDGRGNDVNSYGYGYGHGYGHGYEHGYGHGYDYGYSHGYGAGTPSVERETVASLAGPPAGPSVVRPVWHLRATWGESLERARIWREKHPDQWPSHQHEQGDAEEAKVYRWLIEQRRYKRNFEAGKKSKLGGMSQERLDLMNEVLGEEWVSGNSWELSQLDARMPSEKKVKRKKKEPVAVKKRPKRDGHGDGAEAREEGSSGLNYMASLASLASHEMDAMRQAQHNQQQHAFHQQALHEQARLEQALQEQTLHQQVLQAAHLVGQRHGYGDPHQADQGQADGQRHHTNGYGGYDGRQYHSTQQQIHHLAHSRGIQHVQAYAQAHPIPQMPNSTKKKTSSAPAMPPDE